MLNTGLKVPVFYALFAYFAIRSVFKKIYFSYLTILSFTFLWLRFWMVFTTKGAFEIAKQC